MIITQSYDSRKFAFSVVSLCNSQTHGKNETVGFIKLNLYEKNLSAASHFWRSPLIAGLIYVLAPQAQAVGSNGTQNGWVINNSGGAVAQLSWSSASQARQIIPPGRLSP